MSTFEEVLDRDGRLVYRTKGRSMLPMLRQDKDLVIIEPHGARLKPMDVALYKCGSRYVLHRVIRVGDGHYLIRGDNTFSLETVPDGAVLGVLTGFQRNGGNMLQRTGATGSMPAYGPLSIPCASSASAAAGRQWRPHGSWAFCR